MVSSVVRLGRMRAGAGGEQHTERELMGCDGPAFPRHLPDRKANISTNMRQLKAQVEGSSKWLDFPLPWLS